MKNQKFLVVAMFLFLPVCFIQLQAQVTIGNLSNPNPDAVLDLESNTKLGLLLPCVKLVQTNKSAPMSEHVVGMVVYNTDSAGVAPYSVIPGYYYNDGSQWVRLTDQKTTMQTDQNLAMPSGSWIYCPPFTLDWTLNVTGKNVDLFDVYTKNFSNMPSTIQAASPGAPSTVDNLITDPTQFYYVVTSYPESITNVAINNSGVMTYDCTSIAPKSTDFISIIFIKK